MQYINCLVLFVYICTTAPVAKALYAYAYDAANSVGAIPFRVAVIDGALCMTCVCCVTHYTTGCAGRVFFSYSLYGVLYMVFTGFFLFIEVSNLYFVPLISAFYFSFLLCWVGLRIRLLFR